MVKLNKRQHITQQGIIKKNPERKPQTTLPNAQVYRKFGKWTLETYKRYFSSGAAPRYQYVISDGWTTNFPLLSKRDDGSFYVAWDSYPPESIDRYIKKYADKLFEHLRKLETGPQVPTAYDEG